jgi:hypothetical protein
LASFFYGCETSETFKLFATNVPEATMCCKRFNAIIAIHIRLSERWLPSMTGMNYKTTTLDQQLCEDRMHR